MGRAVSDERHIVTPAELGVLGVQAVQRLHDNRERLMPMGLPGMENYFVPLEPGSLTIVQAQTHNGKSWFMNRWMRRMIKYLQSRNRDEVIVWVDTEVSADYLAMNRVSAESGIGYREIVYKQGLDMKALLRAAAAVAGVPLYTIATRLGRDGSEIHLTNIRKGLDMLEKGQVDGTPRKIAAVFIDYLQSLPLDPVVRKERDIDKQRRLQVSRDVDTCRVIGSQFDCSVILGVQAKQTPEMTAMWKALHLPSMYDGQETANIAQRADRIISLSVAARNFPLGTNLEYRNEQITVVENLMFVGVLKQRGDGFPAGHVFAYMLDNNATDPDLAMANVWDGI